jgi:hypothetical protein
VFLVGDIVEVIRAFDRHEKGWVGRQLVVIDVLMSVPGWKFSDTHLPYHGLLVFTSPNVEFPEEDMGNHAWIPEQLKKIQPPDWKVDVKREEELNV